MNALTIHDLKVHFGGVHAVDGVSLAMPSRGIHALIGPNGAGKTSLINAVTGLYHPSAGQVRFGDRDVTGLPPHRLARLGLTRTFQNLQVFWTMSVLENVMAGFYLQAPRGFWQGMLRSPATMRREVALADRAAVLLEAVGLQARATEPAVNLPYGELKRLEIERALASAPRLLCLDEPVAGCTAAEKRALGEVMRRVADEMEVTIVLVEHDMKLVMAIADRITVLVRGRVLADGPPERVRHDPQVISAYLGAHSPQKECRHAVAG